MTEATSAADLQNALTQLMDQIESKVPDKTLAIAALGKLMQMNGGQPIMCRENGVGSATRTRQYIEDGALWITCGHKPPHTYKLADLDKK